MPLSRARSLLRCPPLVQHAAVPFGGPAGAAVPDRVDLFRANALRWAGGNIWRTSHNPYRPGLYSILDAVGVLCWDENRDFARPYAEDMEALVRRDRNHPSVVIWSAGNEVSGADCWEK